MRTSCHWVRTGIPFVDGALPDGSGKPKAKAARFLQDANASVCALKADSPYVSGSPRSGKIGHAEGGVLEGVGVAV